MHKLLLIATMLFAVFATACIKSGPIDMIPVEPTRSHFPFTDEVRVSTILPEGWQRREVDAPNGKHSELYNKTLGAKMYLSLAPSTAWARDDALSDREFMTGHGFRCTEVQVVGRPKGYYASFAFSRQPYRGRVTYIRFRDAKNLSVMLYGIWHQEAEAQAVSDYEGIVEQLQRD